MKKEIKEILNDQEPKFNKDTKEFGIFIKLGDLRKLKEYIEELESSSYKEGANEAHDSCALKEKKYVQG